MDITTKPKAYVVGGQPGAGKSTFTNKLQTEFSNNSLIIELNSYRERIPRYVPKNVHDQVIEAN
ncbi:zeta toxin family protein [Gilliamella sp. B2911]|nr:zeta toxin family protein [Gilliamella sp. B2911]